MVAEWIESEIYLKFQKGNKYGKKLNRTISESPGLGHIKFSFTINGH